MFNTKYMWKQWTNVVLGLLLIAGAYAGVGAGWMVTGAALMTILALWAGVEGVPEREGFARHAH